MLLVFMVLLNFLLAIIVDAFGEVKEGTREKVGRGAAGWLRCCLGWLRACLAVGRWLLAAAARAVLVCVATCVPGSPQVGLHTELARLAAAKWRALMGRLGSGHISDRRLGLLLKSWAGEEGEGSARSFAERPGPLRGSTSQSLQFGESFWCGLFGVRA